MVAVGVVRTSPQEESQERLLSVQTEIDQWIADWQPDAIAVERVFAKANIKGIMGTAQASAIPMLAAARLGLTLGMHTPSEVKAAVTGNGRADKAQVTHMVTRILSLDSRPRPADAADALALAICHLWRGGAGQLLEDGAESNRLQQAHQQASAAPPNRLAQLHAQHRTATRAAAARAGAAGSRSTVTTRRIAP